MERVRELLRKEGIEPRCNDEQLRQSFEAWLWQLRAQEAVAEQVRAEGGVGEEVPSPKTAKRCREFAEFRPGFDVRQIDSRPCCKCSRRLVHQQVYSRRYCKCAGGETAAPRTELQFNSRPYWQSQETTQTPCGGDYRGGLLRRRISHALRPQRGRRI